MFEHLEPRLLLTNGVVVNADSYSTSTGATLYTEAPGVLENDQLGDLSTYSLEFSSAAASGYFSANNDGSFSYSPGAYVGTDWLYYRVSSADYQSEWTPVQITVLPSYADPSYADPSYTDPGYTDPGYTDPGYSDPGYSDPSCMYDTECESDPAPHVNSAPIVVDPIGSVVIKEGTNSHRIVLGDVFLDVDTYIADDELEFEIVSNDNEDWVSVVLADGVIELTFASHEHETASISVRCTDLEGLFATDTFTIRVADVDDAATVTQIALMDDTGYSDSDGVTWDARVHGVVDADFRYRVAMVEFDADGDGITDGNASVSDFGTFRFDAGSVLEYGY